MKIATMKTAKYMLTAAIGVVALIVPTVVRADDVTVTADLTFATCAAASGCEETFDITYGWDNTTNAAASPAVITASGDLGSNFFATPFVSGVDPILTVVSPNDVLVYAAGDPLDDLLVLTLSETGSSLAPGTYTETPTNTITGSQQFRTILDCGPGDGPICASSNIAPSMAEVTVSAVATPEPSSLLLFGTGLLALMSLALRQKRLGDLA